jgi:hypothetical protein
MSTGMFAQELDKNFGFGALFNNATTYGQWKNQKWTDSSGTNHYYDTDWTVYRNGFGGFAFLGLNRFTELNLGFLYKTPNRLVKKDSDGDKWDSDPQWASVLAAQLGLYFKYPIPISDKLVFFPTIGVDGELSLLRTDTGEFLPETWWHDIWLRGGVGMDFFFTESMFLRGHLIYGAAYPVGGDPEDNLLFSHGLLVKLGLGWMF